VQEAAQEAALPESEALFKSLLRDERQAWRELAPLWKVSLGSGEPCQAALQQQVRCFKSNSSLATIRQLGRPGILVLHDENDQAAYALLIGLTSQTATLRVDGVPRTVPLETLARVWRGDYATLWRIPRGYVRGALDDSPGPLADWLWAQLARAQGQPQPKKANRDRAALRARVAAFQRAHGLEADGLAGPTTLMQLNRGIGVDEPRLQTQ
jgi:general secretion pathway protein A